MMIDKIFSRLFISTLLVAAMASIVGAGPPAPFVAPAPEDAIIYHVFLDRFDNGDPSNDDANPRTSPNPSGGFGWHGGDFEGLRQRLPYIAGIGANAIWMSPHVENVRDYHGYAAYNWFAPDPNFGTMDELRTLIEEANALGIAVYFDMVAGHMANEIFSDDPGFPNYLPPPNEYSLRWTSALRYPAPFDRLELFHGHGGIGNFFGQEQELGELAGLDDLKTETAEVQQLMIGVWEFWMEQTGVSGFRIDTVKHVNLGFWEVFLPALQAKATELGRNNYFTFGEIFGGDDSFMRNYIGELTGTPYKLDAAVDFQYYYTSQGVFGRADSSPSNWTGRLQARANALPGHHLKMPNFLDNHDVGRFMSVTEQNPGSGLPERLRRLELALIAHFAAPGPPIVYYGTEHAFTGSFDPQNREDMFDGEFEFGPSVGDNFDPTAPLYQLIGRLAAARKASAPLRRGTMDVHFAFSNGPGVMVFSREYAGERVLVMINTSTQPRPVPSLTIPDLADVTLGDLFNPISTVAFDGSGFLPAGSLPGQGAAVYLDPAVIPPLPVSVTGQEPANGEIGVSLELAEIFIRFSEPMERGSTLAALTVDPALSFTPQWRAGDTELSLTLDVGLTDRTPYTVTIAPSAEAVSGETLRVEAQAAWVTERLPRPLPPLGEPWRIEQPFAAAISIDGSATDWALPTSTNDNSGSIENGGTTLVWSDAIGDDNGPGSYLYPTNNVFSGGDADLDTFAMAWDANNLYFLIIPEDINPGASFFTPYFGIGIDTGIAGRRQFGFNQQTGSLGVAGALAREDMDFDYEIVFTGPRGLTFLDAGGLELPGGEADFSSSTGVVEISIPRNFVGLAAPFEGRRINLHVYTGLEVFGSMREVGVFPANFEPGGGIAQTSDPSIFDLAGGSVGEQQSDLADFDDIYQARIIDSVLPIELGISEMETSYSAWQFN